MSEVAVASHISCGAAYALVTIVLVTHRPTRNQFPLLIISCAFTTMWAILSALYAGKLLVSYPIVTISEIVSNGLWFLCLIQLMKLTQRINHRRWLFQASLYCSAAALLSGLLIGALLKEFDWQPGTTFPHARVIYFGYLAYSILVLALIEQIYRGTSPARRWKIKFLCIGLSFMYCYEFYMYSNAVLLNHISLSQWQIRGAIATTIAPLIVLSAFRHGKWRTEILPSRAVIFRSTVFISCGVYLLFMLSLSYFIREWGGDWGDALQILFLTTALVSLSLILSSDRIRAWTKIFISKNFFKLRYDYREEWMRFSMLLFANDSSRISKRVIKALADLVESPKGVLFEWEEKQGYVLKDCLNHRFPNQDVIIEPGAFTEYLRESHRALELPPRYIQDNRALIPIPEVIRQFSWAWLLVPLFHGDNLHAFVVLAHPRVAFFNVNWEVLDLLAMAGRQAVVCLVQEQNAQALAIARQFEGYNRLSAFVMHDLKNVHSQLKLIQSNKERHENNPGFVKSVYQTIEHTAEKVERLLTQMRGRQQSLKPQPVELAKTLQKVIQLTDHRQPVPRLDWRIPSPDVIVMGDEDKMVNILCHLIENAQQATPENGDVVLSISFKDKKLSIKIQDTGCGMNCDFLHTSLYKPFVTTKGEKGTGIGVYEAREYMHALGGRLSVESVENVGSIFNLEFPIISCLPQQIVA